ncbi:MAG: hypothetical protein CVT73_06500 [Alphaproteobacteria bacterium HGW-Alphaproteobacteria-12]|nr:MAG: hypothetical protein CVT73_06500 [Alphaproteobacteria bacterium HGW-Alphaproteobacteria-12]
MVQKIKKLLSIYLVYGAFSLLAGATASKYGLEFIHGNDKATDVIVTVFSILAGFLIAIMSLLGDASLLPRSWKVTESQRQSIKSKLIRQKWLFYLYLLTLSVIFASSLFKKQWPEVTMYLERAYFGLAVTAFLLSFRLPASLMAVQLDRVDAVIGAKRSVSPKLEE